MTFVEIRDKAMPRIYSTPESTEIEYQVQCETKMHVRSYLRGADHLSPGYIMCRVRPASCMGRRNPRKREYLKAADELRARKKLVHDNSSRDIEQKTWQLNRLAPNATLKHGNPTTLPGNTEWSDKRPRDHIKS